MFKTALRAVVIIISLVLLSTILILLSSALQDHTVYASKFSRTKFKLICSGISETEVVALIGPPLSSDIGPVGEIWYYSNHWFRNELIVTYRIDGRVDTIMNTSDTIAYKLHSGSTFSDVLSEAGPPDRIEPRYYKQAWYSKQAANTGRYSNFAVLYDQNDIVVRTESSWEFD